MIRAQTVQKRIYRRKTWSLDNFDEGYIHTDGEGYRRFRVRLPDHPRSFSNGYILRSIVAYEAYHGISVPREMNIHHKDGDTLNDSKENLEMMTSSEHSRLSNKERWGNRHWVTKICQGCGIEFEIPQWWENQGAGKYCSPECYHKKGNIK